MSRSTFNGPLGQAALSGVGSNDGLLLSSSAGNLRPPQPRGEARPGRTGKPPPSPAVLPESGCGSSGMDTWEPCEAGNGAAPAPGPVLPRAPSVGAPATPSVPNLPAAASPAQVVAQVEAVPRGGSYSAAASPAAAADGAGGSAAKTAVAADMCRRINSFLQTVSRSGLLMSALVALELKSSHPPTDGCNNSGLGWTLAQMLALHLKAGHQQASEVELLAVLWVLEAWGDVWRSPCTVVLQSYLQNLPTFDSQRAVMMSRDWAMQFRALRKAVSDSQMDLLKRLEWRVRLDFAREVCPCWQLLFRLPSAPTTPHAGPRGPAAAAGSAWTPAAPSPVATQPANNADSLTGAGAAGMAAGTSPSSTAPTTVLSVREGWVQQVELLCSKVSRAAQAARSAAAAATAGRAARARPAGNQAGGGEEGEEVEPETPTSPTKRQRFW